eukprot:UN13169
MTIFESTGSNEACKLIIKIQKRIIMELQSFIAFPPMVVVTRVHLSDGWCSPLAHPKRKLLLIIWSYITMFLAKL